MSRPVRAADLLVGHRTVEPRLAVGAHLREDLRVELVGQALRELGRNRHQLARLRVGKPELPEHGRGDGQRLGVDAEAFGRFGC